MTVKELIKALEKLDPNLPVVIYDESCEIEVDEAYETTGLETLRRVVQIS